MARATSLNTVSELSMIHQTVKGMIIDGPLRTRGNSPANVNSLRQDRRMSMRQRSGDVQAIEHVAHHTYGVTLVAADVIEWQGKAPYTWPQRKTRRTATSSQTFRDIQAPQNLPHRHASSHSEDNHLRVQPLRWAPPTSSPLVAGRGFHVAHPQKQRSSTVSFPWKQLPTTYSKRTRTFKSLLKVKRTSEPKR